MKIKFVADDGTEFSSDAECLAYEKLLTAANDKSFETLVYTLFHGCTFDTDDDEVFYLRNIKKFKINLVRALPELQRELQRALGELPSPIGYITDIDVEILRKGGNAMIKPCTDVTHHLPVYVGKD